MNDNKDHLRALLDAYNEVTGFDLPFIPGREKWLRALDKLGHTPADVRAVMTELKRLVKVDARRYPVACLSFANAIINTERFDTRARMLRSQRQGKEPRPKRKSPPAGQPTSAAEVERIRAAAKAKAAELHRKLYGGAA